MPLDWIVSKPSKLVAYFGRTIAIFRPHEICIEENMVGTVAEQLMDFCNNCVQILDTKFDAIMVADGGNIVCNFADVIQMMVFLRLPKRQGFSVSKQVTKARQLSDGGLFSSDFM